MIRLQNSQMRLAGTGRGRPATSGRSSLAGVAIVLLMGSMLGCDSAAVGPAPAPPETPPDPFVSDTSLVVFVVHFEDSSLVAIAPFNDPTSYTYLPHVDRWWDSFKLVWNPTFSPDKGSVYFDSALMARVDLRTLRVEELSTDGGFFRGSSRSLLWEEDGGILAASRDNQGLFYFPPGDTFAVQRERSVLQGFGAGPQGLLMLSIPGGLSLYDPDTGRSRPFPNETVHALRANGESAVTMERLSWSEEEALLVGDIKEGGARRLFIADTLSNTIRELEPGFFDLTPSWGPDGWIFFSRATRFVSPGPNRLGTIYLRHSSTGELRKWLGPESIPRAIGVDVPDY